MSNANNNDSDEMEALAATVSSGHPVPTTAADSNVDASAQTEVDSSGGTGNSGATEDADSPDELIGKTLNDRYEVICKLGQGGMGAVYEAKHAVIGKRVAIKVLLDKHAANDHVVARLKQEARLASSIGHDNIVDITDFGTTDFGRTFFVMEYLEGESLGALIHREGRLEQERAMNIGAQIASALAAAHSKGIVHRDIKPDNIFLIQRQGQDFVKVVDFGISKSVTDDDTDVRLTQTGMVLGTPLYMSPEQASGEEDLDHRVDVYALGVILYEAVTGDVPFRGKNYLSILTQVISDTPTLPTELVDSIGRDLESVILKALVKDPDQRYQSMAEIAADLLALMDPDGTSTGARITAARWRQTQGRSPKRKYIQWGGGAIVVASLSVLAVTSLLSQGVVEKAQPIISNTVPEDASVIPAAPIVEVANLSLTSTPTGAAVYHGARQICSSTPCQAKLPKTPGQLELRVELEDYAPGILPVRPQLDDGESLHLKLQKLPKVPTPNKLSKKKHKKPNTKPAAKKTSTSSGSGDVLDNPYQD